GGPGPALRRLPPAQHGAGKGSGLNGAHRREGLFVLSGAGVRRAGMQPAADIVDIMPTLLALAGAPIPIGLDGAPMARLLSHAPRWEPDPLPDSAGAPQPYG